MQYSDAKKKILPYLYKLLNVIFSHFRMSSASMASSVASSRLSEPREMPTILDQPDSVAVAETVREGWLTCKVAAVDGKVSESLLVLFWWIILLLCFLQYYQTNSKSLWNKKMCVLSCALSACSQGWGSSSSKGTKILP